MISETHCRTCDESEITYRCKGCLEEFCFQHLEQHRLTLHNQLGETENDYDQFLLTLTEQKNDPNKRRLIQKVEQWENDSIEKIKQTAQECKRTLIDYTNKYSVHMEKRLHDLKNQLTNVRHKNEINEKRLNDCSEKLKLLKDALDNPSGISIEEEKNLFINKISVTGLIGEKWKQNGITVAGGNDKGSRLNQLSCPRGIYVDSEQSMYIVDFYNHRIVLWKNGWTYGRIIAGGKGEGNRTDQLSDPLDVLVDNQNDSILISDYENRRVMRWSRQNNITGEVLISDIDCWGLAMDKSGDLYVSDYKKHEVIRWREGEKQRTVVAGGNEQGDGLHQLSHPTYLFIDEDDSVYVSDTNNDRVMKWRRGDKEGVVVAGGNGKGNGLKQLSNSRGVVVDHLGHVYVAEKDNARVMRWCKGASEGSIVVGGNGVGERANQLKDPEGLCSDRQGNLYISDWGNHRIQKYEIDLK